jgi:hypothetical protein
VGQYRGLDKSAFGPQDHGHVMSLRLVPQLERVPCLPQ